MSSPSLLTRAILFYGCRCPDHPRKWWVHDRLRTWNGARIDEEVSVKRGGLRWCLNPADYAQSQLFWLGHNNVWEMYHLQRLLPSDCVFVDAGANFGYHAATLAAARKGNCRALALEPHPDNYSRLQRHVKMNGFEEVIECYPLAVADAPGTAAMVIPKENSGHARIVLAGENRQIPVTTLDAFVQGRGLDRLDALLLDVEGFEERALYGAQSILERLRPLIMVELWPPVIEQQRSTVAAVVALLREHGYELYVAQRRRLVPLVELPSGDHGVYAFCFHKDRIPPAIGA